MIAVCMLNLIDSWLTVLGIITTSFATLMIADYVIIRKRVAAPENESVETVNIAGVITIIFSSTLAYVLEYYGIFVLGFLLTLIIVLIMYPLLRVYVFCKDRPSEGLSLRSLWRRNLQFRDMWISITMEGCKVA